MQTNVINQGDKITNQSPDAPRRRSNFNLSRALYMTTRFGEISPSLVLDTIPGDKISLRGNDSVETLSFKAPLMDSVTHKKDAFFVPYSAILPRTWQQFITQPNIGDDIPSDAGTGVDNMPWIAATICGKMDATNISNLTAGIVTSTSTINGMLRWLITAEAFYSAGSLLNECGYNLVRAFGVSDSGVSNDESIDDIFDQIIAVFVANIKAIRHGSTGIWYHLTPTVKDQHNLRDWLEVLRNGEFSIAASNDVQWQTGKSITDLAQALLPLVAYGTGSPVTYVSRFTYYNTTDSQESKFNLARLFAYQIAVSHYYSNDSVDYIYTADLYRENLYSLLMDSTSGFDAGGASKYTWNGTTRYYEACSGHWLERIANWFAYSYTSYADQLDTWMKYLGLVFSHRNSLRYVDFFTGLRTRPLAIGNTDITVSGGVVDVIDVTRSIQLQRFLNAVNRTGRKISNYISGLFGVMPEEDICDPKFLYHTQNTIFASKVENTGAAQMSDAQSQTSRLGSDSNFIFECAFDAYGIVVVLNYYDTTRKYPFATDSASHIVDRYDLFNPYLENIGDQPCSNADLDSVHYANPSAYGYQQRYMQYKQSFDRACGGFVGQLPGFIFKYEDFSNANFNITPDAIRSHNKEIDDFFLSLTGYSLGTYFHFINRFGMSISATREMSSDAKIL